MSPRPTVSKIWVEAKQSPFLRNNAIFFFGSLAISVLNYLFYPVLGRLMSPAQFGEVQALMSIYAQGAILLSILTYVTVHVTVNNPDADIRNKILLSLERVAILAGMAVLGVGLLLINQLKDFLNFNEALPFVALNIALALSIPLTFRIAYLRGLKQFSKSLFSDGIGSLTKLLIAPILIISGLGTFGAISGLALSQLVSILFAAYWSYRAGFIGFGLKTAGYKLGKLKPQLKYALAVFLASSVVMAIFSIDIIATKHYFSAEQAGFYAGASTVARIIFFVIAPFTSVLVTMVSLKQSEQKNRLQVKGSLVLMILVGGLSLCVISAFPKQIIGILIGTKYEVFADLLPRLGLAFLILAISNAILMYHIALRRYIVAILATLSLALTVCLIYWNNATAREIVNDVFIGSVALLFTAVTYTVISRRGSVDKAYGTN